MITNRPLREAVVTQKHCATGSSGHKQAPDWSCWSSETLAVVVTSRPLTEAVEAQKNWQYSSHKQAPTWSCCSSETGSKNTSSDDKQLDPYLKHLEGFSQSPNFFWHREDNGGTAFFVVVVMHIHVLVTPRLAQSRNKKSNVNAVMCEYIWLMMVVVFVCRWVTSMCVCICVWEGGLEGYVFCCDNFYYGSSFFTFFKNSSMSVNHYWLWPWCSFYISSLN